MSKRTFNPGIESAALGAIAVLALLAGSRSGQDLLGIHPRGSAAIGYLGLCAFVAAIFGYLAVGAARARQMQTQADRDAAAVRDAVPHETTRRDDAPRDAPRDATPRGAPRDATPRDGVPRDDVARDATPREGAPRDDAAGAPATKAAGFSLYLRPFLTGGKIPVRNSARSSSPVSPSHFTEPERVDLEIQLARACENTFPLRAIGGDQNLIGAGKVRPDDDSWKGQFVELARSASVIFAVPLDQPGTRWELEWLQRTGLLDRAVLIMPPEMSLGERRMSELWDEARTAYAAGGIRLPAYRFGGQLLLMTPDGEVATALEAKDFNDSFIGDLLRRLGGDTAPPRRSRLALGLAALACGGLWGATLLAKDALFSFEVPAILLLSAAAAASAASLRLARPGFPSGAMAKIVYHWLLAFFAGLLGIVLADEYLGWSSRRHEILVGTPIFSILGAYATATATWRVEALLTRRRKHLLALSWWLPSIALFSIGEATGPGGLGFAGWGLGAAIGIFLILLQVRRAHTRDLRSTQGASRHRPSTEETSRDER